jgi:hypothetical protein
MSLCHFPCTLMLRIKVKYIFCAEDKAKAYEDG